jgi:Zn-dependent peptidase ImmA (M78 family)
MKGDVTGRISSATVLDRGCQGIALDEMAGSIRIAPGVLASARTDYCHLTLRDAATRLGIPQAELAVLEAGTRQMTLSNLERIAQRYRLSLNYFLLNKPQAPRRHKNYRTLQSRSPSLTFDTSVSLRLAEQLQENLAEIVSADEIQKSARNLARATLSDDIESLAQRERERLGVSVDEQLDWRSLAVAFQAWRSRIESLGISVFLEKMNLDDCRGLSMFDDGELPAIVVNDRESTYPAKTFTLLHEYGHLLLRMPGISDERPRNAIERFCNQFAAAVMMPVRALVRVLQVAEPFVISTWTDRQVARAANNLKVSQIALAIRMEDVDLAPKGFSRRFDFGAPEPAPKKKGSGRPMSQALRRLRELGSHYTYRVLSALSRQHIDTTTAARMLNSKAANFSEIQNELALNRRLYATSAGVRS